MPNNINNYGGYQTLAEIPPEMAQWELDLVIPTPSAFGCYALVGCETNLHEHKVIVIDEKGQPLKNILVVFGWSGGQSIGAPPGANHWNDYPYTDLRGNPQKTNAQGEAKHTYGLTGGEDIFILDIDEEGDLKLPSPILKNCRAWREAPCPDPQAGCGVKLTFQRRRKIDVGGGQEELTPFMVHGRVTEQGRPLVGVTVKAFDKDLRSEELLGETTTDEQGGYEIGYTASQFRRAEKKSADLVVQVFRGQALLTETPSIIFHADPVETVDLAVGTEAYIRPSEYEYLVAELAPLLSNSHYESLR